MAITQYAYQSEPSVAREFVPAKKHISPTPIDLDHVSVSQLLGRDYVFIDANRISVPFSSPQVVTELLDNLLKQLEVTEAHTVVVTFTGQQSSGLTFTRHDLTWQKHRIFQVETHIITNHDQQEFMDMIWQCSTSVLSV